jgi:hypothetical protein
MEREPQGSASPSRKEPSSMIGVWEKMNQIGRRSSLEGDASGPRPQGVPGASGRVMCGKRGGT